MACHPHQQRVHSKYVPQIFTIALSWIELTKPKYQKINILYENVFVLYYFYDTGVWYLSSRSVGASVRHSTYHFGELKVSQQRSISHVVVLLQGKPCECTFTSGTFSLWIQYSSATVNEIFVLPFVSMPAKYFVIGWGKFRVHEHHVLILAIRSYLISLPTACTVSACHNNNSESIKNETVYLPRQETECVMWYMPVLWITAIMDILNARLSSFCTLV